MTSQLLKSRRITRLNILPLSRLKTGTSASEGNRTTSLMAFACVAMAAYSTNAEDPLRGDDPFSNSLPGESVQRADPMDSGPLSRLRKRSPGKRWKETKQTWALPTEARRTAQPFASSSSSLPQSRKPVRAVPATTGSLGLGNTRSVSRLQTANPRPFPGNPRPFAESNGTNQANQLMPQPQFGYASLQPTTEAQQRPSIPDGDGDPLHRKITEILPFHDYIPSDIERGKGVVPVELDPPSGPYQERKMTERVFTWEASNLYHMPLYFDDPTLERYGHTHHEVVQPFVSTARFGVQLFGLPYTTAIDPICKKQYTLGFYRPGECVPYLYHQVPFNEDAFATAFAFYSGMFFLFP